MRRKKVQIIVLCEFLIMIFVVYGRIIIPQLNANPLMHDIASDYIGAQALLNPNEELYPMLDEAFQKIGISWAAHHTSTHPPTAYLLVVPLTIFNYPLAQVIWMLSMFACIVLTWHTLGFSWSRSLFFAVLSLLWPPTIWSLGQLTPIWMLGLALAYCYRNDAFKSGLYIGIASIPKYLASIIYHIWRRKWKVLIGFGIVWVVALGAVLLLRPDAISSYVSANTNTSLQQIMRPDNSALIISAWRLGGWIGIIALVIFILWVTWVGLHNEGVFGWACLAWLGIALLPIAWLYSILPLLPWLVITIRSSGSIPRILAVVAIILPYLSPLITLNPWAVSLSIALSGIAFALAAMKDGEHHENEIGKLKPSNL